MKRQLACKLSHYEAIKLSKKRNYKNVLILEDDCELSKANLIRLNKNLNYIDNISVEWDMLYLYGKFL